MDLTASALRILGGIGNPHLLRVAEALEEARQFGDSQRYRELELAASYYRGTQHDWKRTWWDGRPYLSPLDRVALGSVPGASSGPPPADAPPWYLRRPFVQYQLARAVVDRFTSLLFGRSSLPRVVPADPADSGCQPWIEAVIRRSGWWRAWRTARTYGGSVGSAAVGIKLRGGRPIVDVYPGQHCTPLWQDDDPESGILAGIEICYRRPISYRRDVLDALGRPSGSRWEESLEWYRRIVTPDLDLAMAIPCDDAAARAQGGWRLLEQLEHRLGFVPFVWVRNTSDECGGVDGAPDCAGQWGNLDALDACLSDAFSGTRYNADPTLILRTKRKREDNLPTGSGAVLWLDPGDEASLLELAGTGGSACSERAVEIRDAILRSVRCVLDIRPTGKAGAATATEIAEVSAPMWERADELREIYGSAMAAAFGLLIRIAGALGRDALEPRLRALEAPAAGDVLVEWQDYTRPTAESDAARVRMAVEARSGLLITQETAVRSVASVFGIADPAGEAKELGEEGERRARDMLRAALAGPGAPGDSGDAAPAQAATEERGQTRQELPAEA